MNNITIIISDLSPELYEVKLDYVTLPGSLVSAQEVSPPCRLSKTSECVYCNTLGILQSTPILCLPHWQGAEY